jgi:serine/threonine-protein kinase
MVTTALSRERWAIIEPLLDAALELEPEKRSTFLDEACSGNPALRAEVNALLLACERGQGLLASMASVEYAPLLATLPPELPRQLGTRYSIVRQIGQGGMATVYLAADTKHARQVAVKVLHADVERVIGRDRFLREIEIAAGLSHPHILPLHDSGEVPGGPGDGPAFLYFVAPFVSGESLRERLRRDTRLPRDEAVRLGIEIALALDYAHRQGVIHLDVKPGNILLQDGHAIIADFGIARAISSVGDEHFSRTMPLLGTPSYMSPEHAQNIADVDGRSDIYSLGCVLYEMISGDRPFARESPHDRHTETPVDTSKLESYVSPALAAVIRRAMSPEREERFPTAGELARALRNTSDHRPSFQLRRSWKIGGGIAVAAIAALAFWATRGRGGLDADLLAVAPFDVEAPSLKLWKEGLVDVMSRNLDGAGPLRTVPASVVIHKWRGRADAPSAGTLGRETGARLVLFGGLLAARDSVRAMAVLFDAATGKSIAEIEARDDTSRVDKLSDSLTVAVLRELGRLRHIDMARATSSPSRSIAALKTYLQGEQFYRAALWDSAEARFASALRLDTTFALAYHRLAGVRTWRDQRDIPDSAIYALMRAASLFPRGLGPRELLLVRIDSLSAEASYAWQLGIRSTRYYIEQEALLQRLFATLEEGMLRYPGDPEFSFLLADAHSQFDDDIVAGEVDDRQTLALYDRAISLDSSFAPAYVRPMALAAYLDGADHARKYIRAYLAVAPADRGSAYIRIAEELLDPARAESMDFARIVDTLPPETLCDLAGLLRHIPDSAQTIVRLGRVLIDHALLTGGVSTDLTCAADAAMDGLQFRGHLHEALHLAKLNQHGTQYAVLYNLSRAGMLRTEDARAEFKKVLPLAPRIRLSKLVSWWATDHDTAAIQIYMTQYALSLARPHSVMQAAIIRADMAAGYAYLALAKDDSSTALKQLLTTPDTLHKCWSQNRLIVVRLLLAARRYQEAAGRLQRRWPGTSLCDNGFDDVLWRLERARIFEQLGRRREAATEYAFVVDAWRTGDAELQGYVRESLLALRRLGG